MATFVNIKKTTQATGSGVTVFNTKKVDALAVGVTVSAVTGSTHTLTIWVEEQGADGNWYSLYHPSAISTVSQTFTTIGPTAATAALVMGTCRFRWAVAGTGTPKVSFTASVIGREV